MDITPKEAYVYRLRSGRCPFERWLDSLGDRRGRAKIRARVARIRAGNLGNCRSVGGGVLEMKVDFGPGYRVYFGEAGPAIVMLLCGGDKSTQREDIKTAHQYWADYWRRSHEAREKLS